MVWSTGHQIAGGKYTVEKLLGEGGFCCTYLAKDDRDRPVAIKTLNAKRGRPKELTKRQQDFANEALWLAKCHHPNIVAIEEMVLDGLRWCMVLEYLPGPDLNALVKRQGALSEARSLDYIQQLGGAIAHMHGFGLLHRDIKPLNVLTRGANFEEAVLIDFGVARPFRQGEVAFHPDYTTRGFAPLEQYDRQGKRGAFTDVYGLAATLYFLVTGEVPRSPLTRVEHLQKQEPDPLVPPQEYASDLGDRTAAAIQKGLALQPEDRPQTIQDFLEELGFKLTVSPLIKEGLRGDPKPTQPPTEIPESSSQSDYESAMGLDFEPLRELLDTNQWQEADQETARLLQEMAGCGSGQAIAPTHLDNIPCRDLRTLANLWEVYSNGRFGLLAQRRLWLKLDKDYGQLATTVGWSRRNQWLGYGELQFHPQAPVGHLPTWGRRGKLWPGLCDRLKTCFGQN